MNNKPQNKVLIIEDDLDIANVYSLKFNKEGYDVAVAADGEEGLKQAKTWRPDVILLDIQMPKANGFEVLQALKQDLQTKNIKIIMWTNLSEVAEARRAKALGADDYLVKVFNMPSEIVERVRQHLDQDSRLNN